MTDVGDMYTDATKQCILTAPLIVMERVMKFIDRAGQRFDKLLVKEFAGKNNLKKVLWKCLCDCGKESIVVAGSLVTGNTTSCGCDAGSYKHGGTGKGSYNSWRAMIRRCTKPQDKDYKRYGGIGITVCDRWLSYVNFVADMGEPVGNETLDRIDPAGSYEPSNTRWASPTVQARNIKVPKSNKTGITGVLYHNNKYYACITVKKKKYYSCMCNSIEEAAAARKELEQLHWNK